MNEEQSQASPGVGAGPVPAPQPLQPQMPPMQPMHVSGSQMQKAQKKKKGVFIALVLLCILLFGGGGAAYYVFMYLPNTPENVLKKALLNYSNQSGGYSFSGRLDQGDSNNADFTFTSVSDTAGHSETTVSAHSVVQTPSTTVLSSGGKYYVKFSNFWDSKELAKHYTNATKTLTLEEYIARFADKSGVAAHGNEWMQVDDFIVAQPRAGQGSTPALSEKDITIGANSTETVNGEVLRKYEVTANSSAIAQLANILDKQTASGIFSNVFTAYNSANGPIEQLKLTVWVNPKTKSLTKVTYAGRPFKDATLNFELAAAGSKKPAAAPDGAPLATRILGYGIVWDELFNSKFQQANSATDRERIADMKGIKAALEIYKAKNGSYPDRYEMAVNQQALLGGKMDGVDFEIFKDPNGRFIGLNGSQYAYVGESADGSQDCGRFSTACQKFFIVTTLDDNTEYQLNSD